MNHAHPKRGLIFLLIIIIVISLGLALRISLPAKPPEQASPDQVNHEEKSQWQTYRSDKYNVEFQYPADWKVIEEEEIPGIHIVKKDFAGQYPTHHSNATHVSIFPQGIGTEGVSGVIASTTLKLSLPVKSALDYKLQNGDVWASYIDFKQSPAKWQPWGFVWAGLEVRDLEVRCVQTSGVDYRNGEEYPESRGECDMGVESAGSQTVQSGSVSGEDRQTEEKIISTFKFINN